MKRHMKDDDDNPGPHFSREALMGLFMLIALAIIAWLCVVGGIIVATKLT